MKILITGGSGFIGTNLVDAFAQDTVSIFNYSNQPPLDSAQARFWRQGDILDAPALRTAFEGFQPDCVIHLAARADCDESTTVETGYPVNTTGTKNVLDAIRITPSVKRAIITSTQFVCGPGRLPQNDEDYFPETVYGHSKVITERLTRDAGTQLLLDYHPALRTFGGHGTFDIAENFGASSSVAFICTLATSPLSAHTDM